MTLIIFLLTIQTLAIISILKVKFCEILQSSTRLFVVSDNRGLTNI